MSLETGDRLGRYEILGPLGAGGMGEVYRTHDPGLEREIALKVLPADTLADENARARMLREARMAARLNQPHVCTVHEVGDADGHVYIAMELVEGEPLDAVLASGPLPVDRALRLGTQVADALAHAHERDVVHRDLKTANVVITPEARAKVLDFGLAKQLMGEELAEATTELGATLTMPGSVVGTVAYMAPEQLRGQPADARSDVWALGIVLYEMLGGRRPFAGQTGYELSSAILKEEPPPLPDELPASVTAVVERCLAKEASDRFESGEEARTALETAQTGGVVTFPTPRPTALPRRSWWLAGAALAVIVAVLAVLDLGGIRRLVLGRSGKPQAVRMAVLPFVNLTGDPEQEYLADGMTQEMISQLGRLHPEGLSVIARSSVMRYKAGDTPIDQIGRELGVDYVLEGSAQKEGVRVRVSAELIQVKDQTQLWADSFEREMSSILALQSEVARKVAESLALKLLPAEQARLAGARQVNPEAYEAYLKGSQHWIKMTKGDLDTAEAYFNLALDKDPDFAPAYAGLARVWRIRNQMGHAPPSEAVPKARRGISIGEADSDSKRPLPGDLPAVHRSSLVAGRWTTRPTVAGGWSLGHPPGCLMEEVPGGLFPFGDTSAFATPSPVPGTRSHAQTWTAHPSHRVPGTTGCLALPRSIGDRIAASTRPLPQALPAGAPCHNVGTRPDARCNAHGPNIVKDGTPQIGLSSACCSRRTSDPQGALSPTRSPREPGTPARGAVVGLAFASIL